MNHGDLETLYEKLATTLGELEPAECELYLAKLVLALCDTIGDVTPCLEAIEECRRGLGVPEPA